jgi:hypothetical protein
MQKTRPLTRSPINPQYVLNKSQQNFRSHEKVTIFDHLSLVEGQKRMRRISWVLNQSAPQLLIVPAMNTYNLLYKVRGLAIASINR